MRLAYAFLAEAAETIRGRFYVFGGGIEEIKCDDLPVVMMSLAVVAKIQVEGDEVSAVHTFKLTSEAPDGTPFIPELTKPLGPVAESDRSGRPVYHLTVVNAKGMLIRSYGPHFVTISINDEVMSRLTFHVLYSEQDQPGQVTLEQEL